MKKEIKRVSESVYMTRNEKSPLSHVDSYTLGLFWQTTADFRTKFMNPLVLPLKSHSFISPRTRLGGQVFNITVDMQGGRKKSNNLDLF